MAGVPTTEPEPGLVLEPPVTDRPAPRKYTGILLALVGIFVMLAGLLYVAIEHTGVFKPSAVEVQCEAMNGSIRISTSGGRVCDVHPTTADGEPRTVRAGGFRR